MSLSAPTPSRLPSVVFYSCIALEALALCAFVASARDCRLAVHRHVLLYIGASLPFAAALMAASRCAKLPDLRGVVLLSLCLRAIAYAGPVLLSDDIYRYVWDGRVQAAGIDPYAHPPADEALRHLRDENWKSINHPSMHTIYPAGAQLLFAGLAHIASGPNGFRATMGLLDVAVVALIFFLALAKPDDTSPIAEKRRAASRAALAYALCPLPCVESAMSGHLDSAALAAFLGSMLVLGARNTRGTFAGALLGLGAAIKLAPGLLLPFFVRRRWTTLLGFCFVVALCFAPFVRSGWHAFETLDAFARKWEANAGPFALVKLGAEKLVEGASGASSNSDMVHLRFLDDVALALQDTIFSLHKDGPMDPLRPGAFSVSDIALVSAKLIGAIVLLAAALFAWRRHTTLLEQSYVVLAALVIVTPVLHPWYVLWILPLAAIQGAWPWFAFAAVLPLGYLPLESWWKEGIWRESAWSMAAQSGTLLSTAGAQWLHSRHGKKNASTHL